MGDTVKHQYDKATADRLKRCEGHLRAVRAMLEEGRSCETLFVQLAAVRSAMNQISLKVYERHIDHCLSGKSPKDARARELKFISKLLLSGKA